MRMLTLPILLFTAAASAQTAPPLDLYTDALSPAFQNWSWAGGSAGTGSYNLANASPTHAGSASIRFLPQGWGGLLFADVTNVYDAAQYESLTFWIHGGSGSNQVLQLALQHDASTLAAVNVGDYTSGGIVAGTWHAVTIPFNASTGLTAGSFNRVQIMDFTGGTQAQLYIDDIRFNPRTSTPPAGSQSVSIDLSQDRRPVSPLIFGISYGSQQTLAAVRYPLRRWGGNSTTRYNWQADVHSTAGDYFYQNIPDTSGGVGNPPPGNSADAFIDEARANGGEVLMTIPTIGWVPIDDRSNKRWGFSQAKYGPQLMDECRFYAPNPPAWCTADSGNGECDPRVNTNRNYCIPDAGSTTHGLIKNNAPTDTSFAAGPTFWPGWIAHLQARYGTAANGGVRFYALDNEPMLWNSTHRDVHPIAPTYEEVWTKGRDTAIRIKSQDPNAKIFGPVTWGYPDLFTSAADAEDCNCMNGPDRQAHAGKPFVGWYLEQVCAYQQQHGVRLVDYLDLHYYPQGSGIIDFNSENLGVSESASVQQKRLRSLKELYDPTYVSESWIADLGDTDANHYSKPGLLPRVKAWIDQYCPGTKIAITEYNWGPDRGATGALAQAEALAIFAREGVDAAMRWGAPEAGSYAEDAFKLYLNYDGAFSRVAGDSVRTTASAPDTLSAYAIHQSGQKLFLLLFNKSTSPQNVTVTLSAPVNGTWNAYRFHSTNHLAPAGSGSASGTTLSFPGVPARSSTLVVLPNPAGGDVIFANGFQ
ncbi:glycoside hydrolase family 44 protein [Tahibacter amnicola]|uniref:Glycoside hydrolase family 44 protein n=1 Tax=Tahibacter amnicola TaxID=2976241 RepID=A0ABY6BJW8_9GAMM|nr:glycoside hydrolase family 44 protein [Tahibacter amnicola]UXI69380.1 glycoside hydrolase family 44 protein [Tahibacter amnicola]